MTQWTVVLKGMEGLHFEVIEADTVEWGKDGRLVFSNMKAIEDTFTSFISMFQSMEDKNTSDEQLKREIMRLIRAIGQVTVASFERESIAGFFKGLRANVNLQFEMKS